MNYFKEELMSGTEGGNGSPLDSISFEDIYEYNAKEFE